MGRSNGCEANRKRADAAKRHAKYNKDGNSQTAANEKAMSLVCQQCFQTFMCTQRKMAEEHAAAKHPKLSFEELFPDCGTAEEMTAAGKKDKKGKK